MIDTALAADTVLASLRQSGWAEYAVADDEDAEHLKTAVLRSAKSEDLKVRVRRENGYVMANVITESTREE